MTRKNLTMAIVLAVAASLALFAACKKKEEDDSLTQAEASEGMDQTVASTSAELTVDGIVEISTNFTMGQAVADAAAELRDWAESQIPCSTATLKDATVTIDFGTLDDNCVYNGKTWGGTAAITLVSVAEGNVEVKHQWTNLTNGDATVNGTATVTWKLLDGERRVVHELAWSHKGKSWTGWGDRTQKLLDPTKGILYGIKVDGERGWKTAAGDWTLQIDGVEIRWQDAVPQAGTYTLYNPADKSLSMSFARLADDTIQVTVSLGKWSFKFNVKNTGDVSNA